MCAQLPVDSERRMLFNARAARVRQSAIGNRREGTSDDETTERNFNAPASAMGNSSSQRWLRLCSRFHVRRCVEFLYMNFKNLAVEGCFLYAIERAIERYGFTPKQVVKAAKYAVENLELCEATFQKVEQEKYDRRLKNNPEMEVPKQLLRYLYLMKNKRNGLTKIGISKDPNLREHTLQSQEPEVELLLAWKGKAHIEEPLQEHFYLKRVRGEWFKLTKRDIRFIKEEVLLNTQPDIERGVQ
jgi:ribosomal protein L33